MTERNDNVVELFPRKSKRRVPLAFRKPFHEEVGDSLFRDMGILSLVPQIEPVDEGSDADRDGPFVEPTNAHATWSITETCFNFGMPHPDTGELPKIMPSVEEDRLVQFITDESIPEAWQNVASQKLVGLQKARATEAGMDFNS